MSRMVLRRIKPPFTAIETPFTASAPYTVPNCSWLDLIALGGGAGGSNGGFSLNGQGGPAGGWGTQKLQVGVNIAVGATITVTVGNGGAGQANSGGTGQATTISWTDMQGVAHTITGAAGVGASGSNATGGSAGTQAFDGRNYIGGGNQATTGAAGNPPGGGGAGGAQSFSGGGKGGNGARGQGWIYAY